MGRERGEERTDSCGLHASTTREESEGARERRREAKNWIYYLNGGAEFTMRSNPK